jgi:hemolysin D
VDGTVQQLAVHAIGAVVTPARQLMMIVPFDSHLEVEAMVSNRDVGFVHPGEPAGQELLYAARVSLDRTQMQIDDKLVSLTVGMAVTAGIKTG